MRTNVCYIHLGGSMATCVSSCTHANNMRHFLRSLHSQVVFQLLYSEALYSCGSLVEADVCITEPSFCTR